MRLPKHPSIMQYGKTGKWYCPRCERVAPKKDLENLKLSHGQCYKPHNHLIRIGKPPHDLWKCQVCGISDTWVVLHTQQECVTVDICKYCGERPECAEDCIGIALALSGELTPDVDVKFLGPGQEPPSVNRYNPDPTWEEVDIGDAIPSELLEPKLAKCLGLFFNQWKNSNQDVPAARKFFYQAKGLGNLAWVNNAAHASMVMNNHLIMISNFIEKAVGVNPLLDKW